MSSGGVWSGVAVAAGAIVLIVLVSLPAVLASRRAARETSGGARTFDWLCGFVFTLGGLGAFAAVGAYMVVWVGSLPMTMLGEIESPMELAVGAWFTAVGSLFPSGLAVVMGLFALPGRAADPRKYGRLLGLYGLMLAILAAAASVMLIVAG